MRYIILLFALLPFAVTAQRADNIIIWKCNGPDCIPRPFTFHKEPIEPIVYLTWLENDYGCQVIEEEIVTSPIRYTDITDLLPVLPAIYQQQRGAPLIFNGGRAGEVLYVIDEMRIMPGQVISTI